MLNLYYWLCMFEKLEDLAKNNKKISDFHIRAGSPLAYRATGEIIKVQEVIVTAADGSIVVEGVPQFCGTTCTFVRNAGEVSIDGLEIEGTFRATEALTFRTAIGILDSGYDKFEYDGKDVAAAAQLNFAPDYTASLSWEYVTEFRSGELIFAGTFSV